MSRLRGILGVLNWGTVYLFRSSGSEGVQTRIRGRAKKASTLNGVWQGINLAWWYEF